jgi:hypothetical protein
MRETRDYGFFCLTADRYDGIGTHMPPAGYFISNAARLRRFDTLKVSWFKMTAQIRCFDEGSAC